MCRAVVPARITSSCSIHRQGHSISGLDHTLRHLTDMTCLAARQPDSILHSKLSVCRGDQTGIALLTAHGSIERCLLRNNGSHFTIRQSLHQFRFRGKHRHFRVTCQTVVPYKLRGQGRIDGLIHSHVSTHIIGNLTRLAGLLFLLLHTCPEAFLIHRKSFFFQNFLR